MTHSLKSIVVIPVHKELPTSEERKSLQQCATVLRGHPICFVCPEGLNTTQYSNTLSDHGVNWMTERFPVCFFDGISGYNQLMLDKSFYSRFTDYQYILIYQLDAWVFRDELDEWCGKGYDYIGAPWIEKDNDGNLLLSGVGNGGFSLRRVQHFIDVLSYRGPVRNGNQLKLEPNLKNKLYRFFYSLGLQNTIKYYKKDPTLYEDIFLSIFLSNTKLKANMPDPETACGFAFEQYPSFLYNRTNKLPFGCHAWRKYEYDAFWHQFIKTE